MAQIGLERSRIEALIRQRITATQLGPPVSMRLAAGHDGPRGANSTEVHGGLIHHWAGQVWPARPSQRYLPRRERQRQVVSRTDGAGSVSETVPLVGRAGRFHTSALALIDAGTVWHKQTAPRGTD